MDNRTGQGKKWLKIIGKCFLFTVLLFMLLSYIMPIFTVDDKRPYQMYEAFYNEKNDSVDAVIIGASNSYASWQSAIGWGDYGIAVSMLGFADLMPQAIRYYIEEARKTQPNALYIINANNFKSTTIKHRSIHYLTDFMPFSYTKCKLINALCNAGNVGIFNRIEYFFPIIRFHSGWDSLTSKAYSLHSNGIKGGSNYSAFLKTSTDVSSAYCNTDKSVPLADDQEAILTDLMDYCEANNVKALFVVVPQVVESESIIGQYNTIETLVKARGFDFVNLLSVSEIGIDYTRDYYNKKHMNVHGSLKYCAYFGKYLVDKYGFEDKRGDSLYSSWDDAYEKYSTILQEYCIVPEITHDVIDRFEEIAEISTVTFDKDFAVLKWDMIPEAEGYEVFRKSDMGDEKAWISVGTVEDGSLQYTDNGLIDNVKYTYTVVPYVYENGKKIYGYYNWGGISGKTMTNTEK